jgi:hypothetical protein
MKIFNGIISTIDPSHNDWLELKRLAQSSQSEQVFSILSGYPDIIFLLTDEARIAYLKYIVAYVDTKWPDSRELANALVFLLTPSYQHKDGNLSSIVNWLSKCDPATRESLRNTLIALKLRDRSDERIQRFPTGPTIAVQSDRDCL